MSGITRVGGTTTMTTSGNPSIAKTNQTGHDLATAREFLRNDSVVVATNNFPNGGTKRTTVFFAVVAGNRIRLEMTFLARNRKESFKWPR